VTTDLVPAAIGGAATVGTPMPTTPGAALRDAAPGATGLYLAVLAALDAELTRERIARVAAQQMAEHWRHAALHDRLTGLPNRAWVQHQQRIGTSAVALVDLNGFKPVNDKLGHQAGNVVLRAMARRMAAVDGCTAVRYGGDEFLILAGHRHPNIVGALWALDAVLRSPVPVLLPNGRLVHVRISAAIGWAVVGTDDRRLDEVIACADDAMYVSKRTGEGPVLHGAARRQVAA